MDKGAHFYKCDFQVHSPRDINWTGKKYGVKGELISELTEEQKQDIHNEREQFAKDYLEKMRNVNINAIAVTDHHDIVFAKIIREVAQKENENFIEQSAYEKCIEVFPGIELTLSNPASQCLLIFDSSFPNSELVSIVNFLGLNPSNEFDESTIETVRISQTLISDLNDLHKKLDELGYCKHKYIVLPNVNFTGGDSILRHGFHEHYRKMPCVGGYVDKDISNDTGYKNKLNGGDVNYGNKSIGVISTSDNRFEDGRLFGQHITWIKWAEPTAEALRQAFLAKESRLSQGPPELPQTFVSRIDVTNSKFLGSFVIELNQQYNAFIGGRGTGKSTILEYLRWGLCDQTYSLFDPEEQSEVEKRRQSLIDKTLVPFNGEVRITFSLNGIVHIVKRNSVNGETFLKIGNGQFEMVKEEEVRKILPIQAYSQKQLSNVGVKAEELKRFIEQPISNQLDNLRYLISDNAKNTRRSYNDLVRKKEVQNEIDQFSLEIKSLNDQVENLRKSLTGISEADQKTIAKKQKFDNEQDTISKTKSDINKIALKINELNTFLDSYPESLTNDSDFENRELMNSINQVVSEKLSKVKELGKQMKESISKEDLKEIIDLFDKWENKKNEFETEYELAKTKSNSNQTQLSEIQRIESRLREISNTLNERKLALQELGNPELEFEKLRIDCFKYYKEKLELLKTQSDKFSSLSNGLIKAEVTKSIDMGNFKKQFLFAFQGTRIGESKIQILCDSIVTSDNPLETLEKLINELKALSELKLSEDKKIENLATPILTSCDFNAGNKAKIVDVLTPDKWINIATAEIDFTPEFKYTTNNILGDEIPFSEASAGQQATALLTVLLNEPGIPLIIDQPEDDIDNRAIEDIIKNIWKAKRQRQLIFTSHNANLVVNGDSELVICCDYRESGNQTRGIIKAEGAIDNKIVKEEITSVMEGGEKAFRLRKDKYGF